MKPNNFLYEFIISTDALNTINGGMSMTTVDVSKNAEGYTVNVKPPGVSSDSLKVEINNNVLLIYYLLQAQDVKSTMRISCIIRKLTIPFDVDISKITAQYKGEELKVLLPYNEFSDGYYKEVEILNL